MQPLVALPLGRWFFAKLPVAVVSLLCAACDTGSSPTVIRGDTMGTYYAVTIADSLDTARVSYLSARVVDILDDVNNSMSTYIDDSELSRFNRSRSTEWQSASSQLVTVLFEAQRIHRISNGAFDVTVGPLVNLWGFGSGGGIREVPPVNVIDRTLAQVGGRYLEVRISPPMVRKRIAGLYVDLSAIAKGYAVDRISAALAAAGVRNSLVDIGGELYASGRNADGGAWGIGIEKPIATERTVITTIQVSDAGVATSGDYRIYTEIAGRRYSHEIDPYAGWPIIHRTVLVSVVASSAMEADAWATALLVLGDKAGIDLARRHGIAAYFVRRTREGLEPVSSPVFAARFKAQP